MLSAMPRRAPALRAPGLVVGALLACDPQAADVRGERAAPDVGAEPTGTAGASADGPAEPAPPVAIAPRTPHPFSARDLLAMTRVGSPALSPDGTKIAFTRTDTDLVANRGRSDVWVVGIAGGEPRQLTSHPASDSSPRWAPDGRAVYFVSKRDERRAVWRVGVDGGEATRVTDLPLDVGSIAIAPDGNALAFSAEVFVDCESLKCTADRLAEVEQSPDSARAYDRLFVRHWDTWKDGRRSHLFVVPIASAAKGATPIDVTKGMDADVPSKPFGGADDFAWSADSKTLVFSARDVGRTEPWSTNFDLYSVAADGSATPAKITGDNPAWDAHPSFSPDGSRLAYVAMERAGFEADRFRLVVRDWPIDESKPPRTLTDKWDRSVGGHAWAPDGSALWVTAMDLGEKKLFRVDASSGDVIPIAGDGWIGSPSAAGDRVVFTRNDLRRPTELFSVAADGSDVRAITRINDERIELAQRGEPSQFSFVGAGGDTVHGWVIGPANAKPDEKVPVAFIIHGGPQGSSANRFHYRWNPQTYAGAGYAVVMIDFHGSTGYGQAFTDAIRGDWGGKPLVDLQKGLDAALKQYAFLDGERICALGASYGGYMINWIAGNWPDRFRCLVNHDGIFDQRMMYYATEELWFPEWEHGGPYYDARAGFERHNPVDHVKQWRTPMLVVHGAEDHRVPLEQGLATFTALQRRNVPSRFLYFPDENHWVLKPANSLRWHEEVNGWLDQHLR
jgi:dipeptidyl aminopeptidase/acylaminoacyl peptidase